MIERGVSVFTATRADAGPLRPVLLELDRSSRFPVSVVATGAHLAGDGWAPSLRDLVDGISLPVDTLPVPFDGLLSGDAFANAAASLLHEMTRYLASRRPYALLALGDRWELLPVATAALLQGVRLVHLHGGEVTEGAFDERVRHAISKLADLHLCASDDAKQRLEQLGEEPRRIVVTGAPGLDALVGHSPPTLAQFCDAIGVRVERPFAILTYHVPTAETGDLRAPLRQLLVAAEAELRTVVITAPGPDPGSSELMSVIEEHVAARPDVFHLRGHLGRNFRDALFLADVMLGNSSSGIIEAASARLPVVDVGPRQAGRLHGANVLHAEAEEGAIRAALRKALSQDFKEAIASMTNPYGAGDAAARIHNGLRQLPNLPTRKAFVDLREPRIIPS